jgi:hypothetical protein
MTQKIVLPAWDLLSCEEQESLRDWIKAILNVEKAEARLINIHLSGDVKQSSEASDEYFCFVSCREADTVDLETFIAQRKKILLSLTSCSLDYVICMSSCSNNLQCWMDCKERYKSCIG